MWALVFGLIMSQKIKISSRKFAIQSIKDNNFILEKLSGTEINKISNVSVLVKKKYRQKMLLKFQRFKVSSQSLVITRSICKIPDTTEIFKLNVE